jgi:hypothetical protein
MSPVLWIRYIFVRLWTADLIRILPFRQCQQRFFLNKIFIAYYFLKVHSHQSSKIKSQKEVKKSSRNQGFSQFLLSRKAGKNSRNFPITVGQNKEVNS